MYKQGDILCVRYLKKGDLACLFNDEGYHPKQIGIVLEVVTFETNYMINANVYWQREQRKTQVDFSNLLVIERDKGGNKVFRRVQKYGELVKTK